jgi:hypothetical protein
MAAKSISIPVTGNTAPLRKALTAASTQLNTFGNRATAAAKKASVAMLAVGAAGTAVGLRWTKMAELAAIADQRIEAIAHTMGLFGAQTMQTTKRIQDYADALERETGVTAETIKAAQAKLLTFRQLALTADVAGGAFDRATQAAIDMAAAGFGEATTNAVQLGKALEDPIKGVNSLRRSGITFTESEKAKLAVLVQTNRIHDAQRVILTAIETQVKGTASATALSTARMKNGFGEVTDAIGTKLLPIMNGIADALVKIGEKATLEGLSAAFKEFGNQASIALDKINSKLGDFFHASDGTVNGFGRIRNAATRFRNVLTTGANGMTRFGNAVGITDEKLLKHTDTLNAYTEEQKKQIANDKQIATNMAVLAKYNQEQFDILKKLAKQKEEAEAKAQAQADAAKARQATAAAKEKTKWAEFKDNLKGAQDAIKAYVAGIAAAISANVSLSSSFSEATSEQADAASGITTALSDRTAAYERLNQAQENRDIVAYNKALEDVAAAETAVTKAKEVKPKDYVAIFREQIQAAKDFAGYMKQLIAAGNMSPAAIQQLLDLGPVAGAIVAKDLIAGTGGFTATSLSADLQAVSDAGTAAGMATPGFTDALNATAKNGKGAGNFYITVNAGVGDKAEIGKQVVEALQAYEKRIGKLPIRVK